MLGEPRPLSLFFNHPLLFLFFSVFHSLLLSLSFCLSFQSLHLFICFLAKSPVSLFLHPLPLQLHHFPSPPLLISPSLISHAHRPFSSCPHIFIWSSCPIEPPLFLPPSHFLSSSHNFLIPPPPPLYYTLSSVFCQRCVLSIPGDREEKAQSISIGCISIYTDMWLFTTGVNVTSI